MTRAFTLVELLVSISVIAMLAAILLPVTMRARALARSTQCLSNLGQLGKAIDLYVEMFDHWYPCATIMPSTEPKPGLPRIRDLLEHDASAQVFECPDDRPTDPEYKYSSYYVGEGSSYEWAELFNHLKAGMPAPPFIPLKIDNMPILRDYEPFHKRGSRIGTNCLFTDNHVESF
jgi:prepilin-type N-terminal cleavage/methylation domain-containing protein